MKLVACTMDDLGRLRSYSLSENRRIIEEFAESGLECAKVIEYTQKDAKACAGSLNNSIRVYRMFSYKAITRKGEVYLVRKTDK